MKLRKGLFNTLVALTVFVIVGWLGRAIVFNSSIDKAVTGKTGNCSIAIEVDLPTTGPGYVGVLFDTHIHAPLLVVPPKLLMSALPFDGTMASLTKDVSVDDIVCLLERENTSGAVVLFTLSRFIFSESAEVAYLAAEKYPGKIFSLVMPAPLPGLFPDFGADRLEKVFRDGNDLIRGVGELTFYTEYFQDRGIEPDDDDWLELYKLAGKHEAVVMMHTKQGQEDALRKIFAANPEVNFILHSNEVEQVLPELLAKYPNVYYTLDTSDFTTLFNAENKAEFMSDLKINYDDYLSRALRWRGLMEKYPNRFLWGTDRAVVWHFDAEVSAALIALSRDFISRLSPALQEKYAHENAERLFAK